MPWCPKCKNEYKEGYTVCADCGSNLVDSLDNGPVAIYFGTEAELYEICNFMTSNGISKVQVSFDEKEDIYELLVPSADVSEAQKQLRVYLSRIAAPRMQAETENNDVTNATDSKEAEFYNGPYEEAEKKAEDYKSGADTLLLVGTLGIIALVLLNLGIIPILLTGFTKMLITGVMGSMFVIFLLLGFFSRKSYRMFKEKAGSEKDIKQELHDYLTEIISPDTFDEGLTDDSPSMEILYFRRTEKMKELIRNYSDSLDASFVEYVIEEIYPEIFEQI